MKLDDDSSTWDEICRDCTSFIFINQTNCDRNVLYYLCLYAMLSISKRGKRYYWTIVWTHKNIITERSSILWLQRGARWHTGGTEQILFTGNRRPNEFIWNIQKIKFHSSVHKSGQKSKCSQRLLKIRGGKSVCINL